MEIRSDLFNLVIKLINCLGGKKNIWADAVIFSLFKYFMDPFGLGIASHHCLQTVKRNGGEVCGVPVVHPLSQDVFKRHLG